MSKLYDYLIDNFQLECNSHNATKRALGLGDNIEDIAIFVIESLCRQYHITKGMRNFECRRPTMPEIYMKMAMEIAKRSTCSERSVGCVITSSDFENVYSVGYNGTYPGGVNTCDNLGTKCGCIHAEENALIKCYVKDKNKVVFVTLSPCMDCAKLLLVSGVSTVYYNEDWKDNPGITLLKNRGVQCIHLNI